MNNRNEPADCNPMNARSDHVNGGGGQTPDCASSQNMGITQDEVDTAWELVFGVEERGLKSITDFQ